MGRNYDTKERSGIPNHFTTSVDICVGKGEIFNDDRYVVSVQGLLVFPFYIVYRLKSVEALKMKFVAPMPEQINTPAMHF